MPWFTSGVVEGNGPALHIVPGVFTPVLPKHANLNRCHWPCRRQSETMRLLAINPDYAQNPSMSAKACIDDKVSLGLIAAGLARQRL